MDRNIVKRATFGTSMGISSIIATIVILLLVVFSVLSITTSKADLVLAEKSSNSIKAYYEADAVAEEHMAEIAAIIAKGGNWKAALTEKNYTISTGSGGTFISYTIIIDDYRNLDVVLFAVLGGDLVRMRWQVVPARDWMEDDDSKYLL